MPTNPEKFIKTGPVFSEIIGHMSIVAEHRYTGIQTAPSAGEILAKSFPVEKLSVEEAGFLSAAGR